MVRLTVRDGPEGEGISDFRLDGGEAEGMGGLAVGETGKGRGEVKGIKLDLEVHR